MAALQLKEEKIKKSPLHKKSKKLSTRVDLTPMVDLGFLLITFFVFTATTTQSSSMTLTMPKDAEKPGTEMNVFASGALTLLLSANNRIYYYQGAKPENVVVTNYHRVRDIILEKKKKTPADKLFIIIRPAEDATYANLVNILDEMNINSISRYAVDALSSKEIEDIESKIFQHANY